MNNQNYKPMTMLSVKIYSTVAYDFSLAVTLEFHTLRKNAPTVYVNPGSGFGNIDVTPFLKFVYAKFARDQTGRITSKFEYSFFVPVSSIYKLKYGFKKIMGTLESPNAYMIGNDRSEPAGTPKHLIISQEAYDYSLTKIENLNNKRQNDVNTVKMTATWMISSAGVYSKAFCLGIYGNRIPSEGYVIYMTKDEFEPLYMAVTDVNIPAEATMAGMIALENAYYHGSSNSVLEKELQPTENQADPHTGFTPQPDPMGFEVPSFQGTQKPEHRKSESLAPRNADPNYVSKAMPELQAPTTEPSQAEATKPADPPKEDTPKAPVEDQQPPTPTVAPTETKTPIAEPVAESDGGGSYHDGIGDTAEDPNSDQIDDIISDGDMFN